jgi:hypothetical protein
MDTDINYFKSMNPETQPGAHQRNFVNAALLACRILEEICAPMFYMYLLDTKKYVAEA